MGELIKLAEFDNVNQAYVLKSRLESEGIRVYLLNENLNALLPNAFSAVILQVPLEDSIKAMDIIYEDSED